MTEFKIKETLLLYHTSYSIDYINKRIHEEDLLGIRIFYFFDDQKVDDFSFLKHITGLKHLSLFIKDAVDFDFLYELQELQELTIQTVFSPIDFAKLPQLTSLSVTWNKRFINNIHHLKNLKCLSISMFDELDLNKISVLTNIQVLSISEAKCRNINGIEKLNNLKAFSIGNLRSLMDISAITMLNKIEYLEFDICPKLKDFSQISELKTLQFLEILDCKNIESIAFINQLFQLKQLSLLGTTKIQDMNLGPAIKVPNLFVNSKLYNIKLDDSSKERRSFSGFIKHLKSSEM